ncbi:MAG: hypothetical protein Q9M97_10205 [Candidatus Gracilibacteria bacterium]|nr:hypothetical protein [Candidatus Gracilibacteria bacterium]
MNKVISLMGYLIIGGLLFVVSFVNIEKIINLDFSNIYVLGFFLFFIMSIVFRILGKIYKNKFSKEFNYIVQFILFFCILLLPGFFINHHFLLENLGENNLYLRVYGKIAMGYFAMALIISPILEFIKSPTGREHLILSRKILGIIAFIFFSKTLTGIFLFRIYFSNTIS